MIQPREARGWIIRTSPQRSLRLVNLDLKEAHRNPNRQRSQPNCAQTQSNFDSNDPKYIKNWGTLLNSYTLQRC